jgi:hypothetical protein
LGIASSDRFDADWDGIVYAGRQPMKWMAGSSYHHRTIDLTAPQEDAKPDELIHMVVVYRADNSIAVYRNGKPYGASYVPAGNPKSTLRTYKANEAFLSVGRLDGEVEEVRFYNRALTEKEVAASYRLTKFPAHVVQAPKPDEPAKAGDGAEDERWKDFDIAQATVKDDFLHLPSGDKDILTRAAYSGPLEITLVARTERNNLRLRAYKTAGLIFNWEINWA